MVWLPRVCLRGRQRTSGLFPALAEIETADAGEQSAACVLSGSRIVELLGGLGAARQLLGALLSLHTSARSCLVPLATGPPGPRHCHCFKCSFPGGGVVLFHFTVNLNPALLM